jgi:diguanylate cyclase (GGDEF)-like protein
MSAPTARPKVLVVDDLSANRVAMRKLLGKVEAEVLEAGGGNEALAMCIDHEFALILLDVQMPEMDGFEVAQLLAESEVNGSTPIIYVTAAADDLNRFKGYGSGAVDYIAKPVNDVILLSKVRIFLELYRGRQLLKAEVTERKRLEDIAKHQASHDSLTGLPNRKLFLDRLQQALESARRHQRHCALFYIDIDDFKPVNDQYGHRAGDELLKAIALRMNELLRKSDTAARLGGDEFAVIVDEPADAGNAMALAQRLGVRLREPYRLEVPDVTGGVVTANVGASVGIAMFPEHAQDVEGLVSAADEVMYKAKRTGKNQCLLAGVTA